MVTSSIHLPTEGLISYDMPQGHQLNKRVLLQDEVYDGEVNDGWLKGGLGQLVDERLGRWNLKNKGKEWVGWKKELVSQKYDDSRKNSIKSFSEDESFSKKNRMIDFFQHPTYFHQEHQSFMDDDDVVTIIFKFENLRNFSHIRIHVNNFQSRHIRVFSRCCIEFSLNANEWFGKNDVDLKQSWNKEKARWVRVDLMGEIGCYVKVSLWFADLWLMLSEVQFSSGLFIQHF